MLSNRAMLVNLKISQWTARKLDRKASQSVETAFSTHGRVGNYTKDLLPTAKELDNIQRLAGNIRAFFYRNTLPWFSDGSRILSSKNYLDFINEFRKKRTEFDQAVSDFIQAYPNLRDAAKNSLGHLFIDGEYPVCSELKHTFSCEVSFMPMPDVQDFRTEILESEKQDFLNKMRDVENDAAKECWERLYEVVTKATDKLKNPNSVFRDSLIENITDMCQLLPKLNVTDDANLETMRQSIETVISSVSTLDVRKSVSVRHETAKRLDEITDKMSAFMGGYQNAS
jgi:hypothetical protein